MAEEGFDRRSRPRIPGGSEDVEGAGEEVGRHGVQAPGDRLLDREDDQPHKRRAGAVPVESAGAKTRLDHYRSALRANHGSGIMA